MVTTTMEQPTIGTGAQRWLGGFGVFVFTVAFGTIGGAVGLIPGIVLIALWYWFSSIVGFAFGHIALLLVPEALSSPYVLVVEVGLACLLVSSAMDEDGLGRAGIGTAAAFAILGSLVWFGQTLVETLWPIALFLIIAVMLVAYGFHRYERLKLGLVGEA